MAATVKCYGNAGKHIALGDVDWPGGTINLAFATSAYAVNQGTNEFFSDVTNELTTAGGYTAGGFTLTGCTLGYDSATREERYDADDFSVGALTPSSAFRYGIVYEDSGTPSTSILLAYINFGADQNPAGLPFAIQWAATGVFYIQAT